MINAWWLCLIVPVSYFYGRLSATWAIRNTAEAATKTVMAATKAERAALVCDIIEIVQAGKTAPKPSVVGRA